MEGGGVAKARKMMCGGGLQEPQEVQQYLGVITFVDGGGGNYGWECWREGKVNGAGGGWYVPWIQKVRFYINIGNGQALGEVGFSDIRRVGVGFWLSPGSWLGMWLVLMFLLTMNAIDRSLVRRI